MKTVKTLISLTLLSAALARPAAAGALAQAGSDGDKAGAGVPEVTAPKSPSGGELGERALELAEGIQRAEDLLTAKQKREISLALNKIELALLDYSQGGSNYFFCNKAESRGYQMFSNSGKPVGEPFSFEDDCTRMAAAAREGLVCSMLDRKYQLFGSRGQAIGGPMSFEDDCLENVTGAREGFVCSADASRDYQLYTYAGRPIGPAFSFNDDCAETLATASRGKVCIEEGHDYRLYTKTGQAIGGLFDDLEDCQKVMTQIPGSTKQPQPKN